MFELIAHAAQAITTTAATAVVDVTLYATGVATAIAATPALLIGIPLAALIAGIAAVWDRRTA